MEKHNYKQLPNDKFSLIERILRAFNEGDITEEQLNKLISSDDIANYRIQSQIDQYQESNKNYLNHK